MGKTNTHVAAADVADHDQTNTSVLCEQVKEKNKFNVLGQVEEKKIWKKKNRDGSNKKKKKKVGIVRNEEELKEFIHEINGCDMKFVIQRPLDLFRSKFLIGMKFEKVETHDFLTEEEMRHLDDGGEIWAPLVAPNLQMLNKPLRLTKSKLSYLLDTMWYDYFEATKTLLMKRWGTIGVWSFRKDGGQLCFALVWRVDQAAPAPAVAATSLDQFMKLSLNA